MNEPQREARSAQPGRRMILVVGSFRLPPAGVPAARPAMDEMIKKSREEPGCIAYVYALDLADAGLVHVKELWNDRAALAAHLQTPHLKAWRAAFPTLGVRARDLRRHEVGPGEPF